MIFCILHVEISVRTVINTTNI